eukprot:scaffold157172_cov66-Attheya_sp.AAC.1
MLLEGAICGWNYSVAQATPGKGKSLCMQSAGTLPGGVTLVIVLLLALGADQVTKIFRANQTNGVVKG